MAKVLNINLSNVSEAVESANCEVITKARSTVKSLAGLYITDSGDCQIDVDDTALSLSDDVIVKIDNYDGTNDIIFKNAGGIGSVEDGVNMRIVLVGGQSLSISTQSGASNPIPTQPEISPYNKMFNGVGTVGKQNVLAVAGDYANVVGLNESNPDGFYGLATGLMSEIDGSIPKLYIPTGVGGFKIEDLDSGSNSWANFLAYLDRAVALYPDAEVEAYYWVHGDANWQDTEQQYYDKLLQFKNDVIAAIQARYPSSNPEFVMTQHGGERNTVSVQEAQRRFYLDGHCKLTSGTYWLNRQWPNEDATNSITYERQHLRGNFGYKYQAIALRNALTEKPLCPKVFSWLSSTQLQIEYDSAESLVIDTAQYQLPQFAGFGIEIEHPDLTLTPSSNVIASGNKLIVDFPVPLRVGSRVRIGYTPDDIYYQGDNVTPDPKPIGNYPPALVGTNIRSANSRQSKYGSYFNWSNVARRQMLATDEGNPLDAYGDNCWPSNTAQGSSGFGSKFVWDGVNMTRTLDGVEQSPVASAGYVTGSSNPVAMWAIKAGKTYLIEADARNQTAGAQIRLSVGNFARLTIPSGTGGVNEGETAPVSAQITCDLDGRMELRITNTAMVGELSNIQVREVL